MNLFFENTIIQIENYNVEYVLKKTLKDICKPLTKFENLILIGFMVLKWDMFNF